MDAQQAFQLLNLLALVFWIILIVFYGSRVYKLIISTGLPFILFGLVYLILLLTNLDFDIKAFTSIEKMSGLYSNSWLVLLGWVHYLAFDLLAGVWISNDARRTGLQRILILPSLILTFMLGPLGLLSYIIIKYVRIAGGKDRSDIINLPYIKK